MHRFLLIPVVLLTLAFGAVFVKGRTIIPLDMYRAYQFLYEPGAALGIRTSYLKDITDIYLPWKYYVAVHAPESCRLPLDTPLGVREFGGIFLPGKTFCYPLDGVRTNWRADAIWPLAKVMDFFLAYDLSYFLLLLGILFSSYLLFSTTLGYGSTAVLFSVFFTFSFPVARELQYDGLSQCWPFLLLSLWAMRRAMRVGAGSAGWRWMGFSGALLAIGIARSTLQGLGLWPLLWVFAAFAFLADAEGSRRAWLAAIAATVASVFAIGVAWNFESILIFLGRSGFFLIGHELSPSTLFLRRTGAYLFSWGNFFFGDLLNGFNTVDFSKAVRPLGARESFSYDGNAFFIHPFVGMLFIFSLWREWRSKGFSPAIAFIVFAVLVDYLIAVSPLYRILYLRFHQWWMLFSVLWFCALTWSPAVRVPWKMMAAWCIGMFLLFQAGAFLVQYQRDFILEQVGRQGILGFEPGVWEMRIDQWVRRAQGLEIYALFFWAALISLWVALQRRLIHVAVASACIGGMLMNTFHFNYPQDKAVFHELLAVLERHDSNEEKPHDFKGPAYMKNIFLLVNKPVSELYESLNIDM